MINVGALPYIARHVNPQQFGLAAGVLLVSSLAATAVSGRYEVGAAVADHSVDGHKQSLGLARLALALAATSSLALQIGIEVWAVVTSQSDASTWRWMPLLTFATAASSIQTLLDTRTAQYAVLSGLIVARPLLMVTTVWIASELNVPITASIVCIAYLVALGASSMRAVWLACRPRGIPLVLAQYVDLARRHSKYPRLQVPAALLNALSTSFLAFAIAWSFGAAALGAFSLATRLTFLPATVAGGPINTLYLRESVLVRHDRRTSRKYYMVAVLGSIVVGICATPAIVMISPHLKDFLGPEWAHVDEYIFATLPLMGALLISAPANSALMTYERQRALLSWRILLVACPAVGLFLTGRVSSSPALGVATGSCIAFFFSAGFAFFGWATVGRFAPSDGHSED